jgi:hypothetical protein
MPCKHHYSGRVLASIVEIDHQCFCGEPSDQDKVNAPRGLISPRVPVLARAPAPELLTGSHGPAIKHNHRPSEKGLARNSHHKATRHTN